ncbi:hypothetical protein BD309DRAFT_966797 [Dichomitus squalens]|nr:hypothetical protein BD309DRAFT_966797 [Dichomitus squalens]
MPEFFAILRGVERRFGTVKEFRVGRDHDVTSKYLNYFMFEFADDASFDRIPAAGTNIKIEVPVVKAAVPGGIGLADLAGLLEPQELDPELEEIKHGIYGPPVSVLPPETSEGTKRQTRMVEVIVQRAKRDTAEFPRSHSLYPHRHFGPAFYDWGGFYTPQPGSDDRPVPPLMTAAVEKWREWALKDPRRAAREQEEAQKQSSLRVADEEAERAEAERRMEEDEKHAREREKEIGEMLVRGAEEEEAVVVQRSSPSAAAIHKDATTTTRLSSRREKILERARRNARIPVPQVLRAEEAAESEEQEEAGRRTGEEAKEADVTTLRDRLMKLMGGKW